MIKTIAVVFFIAFVFFALNVSAETAVCSGQVKIVSQHVTGSVIAVVGSSNQIIICNLDQQQYNVTPQSCKHMAALAMEAFATGVEVVLYVDNAPAADCASITPWFTSNTRYLGLYR